ncbi:MAG: phenylalanine--tRNA ligase subunit beta [Coriobacteriia bacterium]|nr:phenylalanine--tRNA ligase subunit beta [Coriobacteriia bacterium]MCL2871056.1 phenylalanine--tRNA ligase subunit beta [Coriobacteriia bacterium]
MRVSLKWLKEMLPGIKEHYADLDNFVYTLDMTGTAVEAVETAGEALEGIVVGHITAKDKHPNADTLWVTQVNIGEEEPVQIVCGADNFEAGDKVPVATVGSILPGDFKIKKSKLRGEVSMGMNCSARELGIGADADGLLILPADAPIGMPFASYWDMADTILDLEITPNRPDCLSMRGIAREMAAVFGLQQPNFDGSDSGIPNSVDKVEANVRQSEKDIHSLATVTVEDSSDCPRYAARVICDVTVGPSPDWLVERVEAAGARSINNIVDITNLVMFETGQPFHAFDLDTIAKDDAGRAAVAVRRARADESITTLDEVERKLTPENLLITDSSGPITLAGVMGAASTEVTEDTTNILLEGAVFDQVVTSRTSRGFQLISESSLRFERGVDIENTILALDMCAELITKLGQGKLTKGTIDLYPNVYERRTIELPLAKVNALLGTVLDLKTCEETLRKLRFDVVVDEDAKVLSVTVPGFRDEVRRDVDLIEEVLRLYGMENTPATLPGGRERIGGLTHNQKLRRKLEQTLRTQGLFETLTLPFGNPADYKKLGVQPRLAQLHNPLSQDQSVLRAQLLPNLLHSVALNLKRGTRNVQLYEVGTVFESAEGRKQPKEAEHVAAVLCGAWNKRSWNLPAVEIDFFDAKGIIETLLRELGIEKARFVAANDEEYPYLQPGRIAELYIGGHVRGVVGELHPRETIAFDIEEPVICFELQCKALYKAAKDLSEVQMPSRYPGIEFDIALLVDDDVSAEGITQRIESFGKKTYLSDVRLFDVYQGKGVPEGQKSLAFSLSYRSDRTLSMDEVEPQHEKLLASLQKATGATLRS